MPETIRLIFAGDTMLGRGVNQVIQRAGPEYPLKPVAEITRRADLFFANLECAISGADVKYSGPPKMFYFRADPPAADTLVHAGVDMVSLANNHALDADYSGLVDTLSILDEKGIDHAGAGEDLESALRPAFLEVKDASFGVLSWCDHQEDFAAEENRPGIHYVDLADPDTLARLAGEVEVLASQVDHVIVACHWQPNWVPEVKPFYRNLGRILVEAGARVVWGHSPHHFQGVEWIGGSVVLYSTGGLVDDYALHPDFRNDRELLFELEVGESGVVRVRAYPIELEFAHTVPAGDEARQWIESRFEEMCAQVGSQVERDGDWLEVPAG